ncbi:MAG: YbhB/YbcL family Raf kinase inhibitor-like protein [Anaerolineales bacterium]|nr:YbhB/YbcL family Raf kinase inhibitor-like protein [Anaerolineales bacterium]MCS7246868.1 YbhB/YbcL family Raf kinase inhibitor-like protein [Anaerolineales bacterium]MDW8160678.1 YbhB/YbcL family Raf kinase inhibitor-like protein [Anaerolineales bacterium]MDW8446909.1 YbhB/YbcL family Raf kinase inhibitor-like protein [Anaerolineales bacterium]
MSIELISTAFAPNGFIPKRYTCDGENLSPPLIWKNVPPETKSLAIIVDDPDAPGGTFVHWVIFNIPPEVTKFSEGEKGIGTEGINDFRKVGYGGPCPPRGTTHRYFFKIYALDTKLNLDSTATKKDLEKAMQEHILAQGELIGRYSR